MNTERLYHDILQGGLRTFKYKNSHLKPLDYEEESSKGAVFGYRNKENMIATRGFVITSEESVEMNQTELSHWTPNVYCYGTYADSEKNYTKGNAENNLKQINTFVVDIDSKQATSNEITIACLDEVGFLPTLIMETNKGYQVYFVLENPAYVTKKSNYKVVKVAKKISTTIRKKLSVAIDNVDIGCNHFGVSRFPNRNNLVMYEPNYRYSFNQWLQWSLKVATDEQTEQTNQKKIVQFPQQGIRQIDEPWFDLLQNKTDFIGSKSTLGRNNAIFTLALAYYSSGKSKSNCEYNLITFNESLEYCLTANELERIINSAYSGNYQGASREFILELCHKWINADLNNQDLFKAKGWYKFKKARTQRKYSHMYEWEADFFVYMAKKCNEATPYLTTSKKELKTDLNIPERTLDKLLNQLKERKKVIYNIKRGRNGGIYIATIKQLLLNVLYKKRETKKEFLEGVATLFNVSKQMISAMIEANVTSNLTIQDTNKITLFANSS
ncbi:MAG: primase C-terminal domain-containing protein [Tetragenococcus koreensis]|nr:primase C-terminal domain-containing protein [Tetragenococcus koreensis]MDN6279222.1 primase C-terminal domain-containing protein [Lactococcus lactis]MDN6641433.1 primase C-terminal domain-containing protein [Tetragenococcus sp.]MDN6842826.1 primase C-terminal domain-containing protein [Staphylococcus equorum]MDN6498096.1 primase C-terminal domain-containing protein [Tetragenococcus koreensis]